MMRGAECNEILEFVAAAFTDRKYMMDLDPSGFITARKSFVLVGASSLIT